MTAFKFLFIKKMYRS